MESSSAKTHLISSLGSVTATKRVKGQPDEVLLKEAFEIEQDMEEIMAKKKAVTATTAAPKKSTKSTKPITAQPVIVKLQVPMVFRISERLAGVFGEYSSLEVGIDIPIFPNGQPFEDNIDNLMPRMVTKIQDTMNRISIGSGFGPCWATPPQHAAPQQGFLPDQGQGNIPGFPSTPKA